MKKPSILYLGITMFLIGSCRPSNESSETLDLLEIKNSKAAEGFHTSVGISCVVDNPIRVLPLIENKIYELNGIIINSELENFKTEEKTERISNDSIIVSYFNNIKNHYQLLIPKKELNNFLAILHPLVIKIDKRNISNTEFKSSLDNDSSKSETPNLETSKSNQQISANLKPDMVSIELEIGQSSKFFEDRIHMPLIDTNKASLGNRLKEPIIYGFNLLVDLFIFLLHLWPLYTGIILIYFSIKYYKSKTIKSI